MLVRASASSAQTSVHSRRQYCRLRYPSWKTTSSPLCDNGPKPGAPAQTEVCLSLPASRDRSSLSVMLQAHTSKALSIICRNCMPGLGHCSKDTEACRGGTRAHRGLLAHKLQHNFWHIAAPLYVVVHPAIWTASCAVPHLVASFPTSLVWCSAFPQCSVQACVCPAGLLRGWALPRATKPVLEAGQR